MAATEVPKELALHLDCGELGSVLFRLNRRGVARFDPETPTYWVTAPTRQTLDLGFLLNAPFSLDLGRSQLPVSWPDNRTVAQRLGEGLGGALVELFDSTQDWLVVSEQVGLDPALKPEEFWRSVWDLLGDGLHRRYSALGTDAERGGDQWLLPRLALWCEGLGMARLASSRNCLPSGLAGRFDVLVSYPSLEWVVEGFLDSTGLLEALCVQLDGLPLFQSLRPGTVASRSRLVAPLEALLNSTIPLRSLRLSYVLDQSFTVEISPDDAKRLYGVFSIAALGELMNGTRQGNPDQEREELQAWLGSRQFRNRCGEYRASGELLIAATTEDERALDEEGLIAGFAPPECILDEAYDGVARKFFLFSRGDVDHSPECLAAWGMDADEEARRVSFIRYLSDGLQWRAVLECVKAPAEGSWLTSTESELDDSVWSLAGDAGSVAAVRLGFDRGQVEDDPVDGSECDEGAYSPGVGWPSDAIERIWLWWAEVGAEWDTRYDLMIYPNADHLWGRLRESYNGTAEQREAWVVLLLLGTFQTMGRTTPAQHRAFLEFFQSQPEFSRLWTGALSVKGIGESLSEFFDSGQDELKWLAWVKESVPVLVSAAWLDQYVMSFLSVNDARGNFDMRRILRPRLNQDFSRGGPDAPPLSVLGNIGGHFVIRELVRHGCIKNARAHSACFVPGETFCGLLEDLGAPALVKMDSRQVRSRVIWEYMVEKLGESEATFGGSFDVPFRILLSNTELLSRVMSGWVS